MAKKDEKPPEEVTPPGPDPQSPKDENPPAPPKLEIVSPKEVPTAGTIEKVDPKELHDGDAREEGEGIPWTIIGIVLALIILGAGIGYYVVKTRGSSAPGGGTSGTPAK